MSPLPRVFILRLRPPLVFQKILRSLYVRIYVPPFFCYGLGVEERYVGEGDGGRGRGFGVTGTGKHVGPR